MVHIHGFFPFTSPNYEIDIPILVKKFFEGFFMPDKLSNEPKRIILDGELEEELHLGQLLDLFKGNPNAILAQTILSDDKTDKFEQQSRDSLTDNLCEV